MAVPPYCRTRDGRVFRLQRMSYSIEGEGVRYTLRAIPIRPTADGGYEASVDVRADLVRDKIRHRQIIATPEATYEQLWQQLRLDLNAQ